MQEFPLDDAITYQDMEPLIEVQVNDPLPEGAIEQQWLELPEIEPAWLELPAIEKEWLELPEIDQEWLRTFDQQLEHTHDGLKQEQDFDMEH